MLIRWLRIWIRALTNERARLHPLDKLWRAALLVPAFGAVLVLLWLRLFVSGPLLVESRTRFGSVMRCHLPDLIQMYIALFRIWEPDLTKLIEQRLKPGDVFIDIGANVGYYTLLASSRVGAAGKVVAIDASPGNFAELQRNLAANTGTDNVRALNRAAADRRTTVQVYAGPAHNLGLATTAPGQRRNLSAEASIEAAPLAQLLEEDEIGRARIIKIDVEGAEPAVVAGMADILGRLRNDVEILLELSPAWWGDADLSPEAVLRPFRQAGFYSYLVDNNYWPWRYLWPNAGGGLRRVESLSDARVKRIDLMLSRNPAA